MSHMSLLSQSRIAAQKIRTQSMKSLLVVLPITLLVIVIIVATSEVFSIIKAVENTVISSLTNQSKVIELTKATQGPGAGFLRRFGGGGDSSSTTQTDYYTMNDQQTIQAIDGVTRTDLVATVPVRPVSISNISGVSNVTISNLSSIDPNSAKIYSTENFDYKDGDTQIPIILSANDLKETYTDWQGKTTITVSIGNPFTRTPSASGTDPRAAIQEANPVKTRSLNVNSSSLIGQTVTINFGGLDALQTYSQSFASGSITFTKTSDADMAAKETARNTAISKYYDYSKISTPLTYTFKIVGVSEGSDQTRTFIPQSFATALTRSYLENEQSARNTNAISSDDYSTYTGLTYDDNFLTYDQFGGVASQIGRANQQNRQTRAFTPGAGAVSTGIGIGQQTRYFVPGLVYQTDSSTGDNKGEYNFTTTDYPFQAQTLLVSISSADIRSAIVSKLNSAGYAFTDQDRLAAINKLKVTLQNYVNIAILVIAVIVGVLVLFALSRFVTDSRREIGIYRALGATQGVIRTQIVTQTMLLTIMGYTMGAILGAVGIFILAPIMVDNVKSIITQAVGNALPISKNFISSDFTNFDWKQIAILLSSMLVLILIISLIPAQSAAKTSPIRAIRES